MRQRYPVQIIAEIVLNILIYLAIQPSAYCERNKYPHGAFGVNWLPQQ